MQRVQKITPWLALGLATLLLASLGFSAWATEADAEATKEATQTEEAAQFVPVTFAGMQVFVDAETGKLRPPTEKEARELSRRMMARISADKAHSYQPVVQKNGTMSVVLGTDGMNYSVAVVQEDGHLATSCVSSQEEADEIVTEGSLGPAREEW